MRHRIQQRKLGVVTKHRRAMLRNMTTSLLREERLVTTLPRAKELRRFAEKVITLSKREGLHARRQAAAILRDREVLSKLFETLSGRYAERPGGYTRIVHLGLRLGDGAEMALVELVDSTKPIRSEKSEAKGKAKPAAAAKGAAAADQSAAAAPSKGRARKLVDKLKGFQREKGKKSKPAKPDKLRKQQPPQVDDAK
jgi:large subunit ribosomal protein L17